MVERCSSLRNCLHINPHVCLVGWSVFHMHNFISIHQSGTWVLRPSLSQSCSCSWSATHPSVSSTLSSWLLSCQVSIYVSIQLYFHLSIYLQNYLQGVHEILCFSKILKYIADSGLSWFPFGVSECTKWQVKHQFCSRTCRVQKNHNI